MDNNNNEINENTDNRGNDFSGDNYYFNGNNYHILNNASNIDYANEYYKLAKPHKLNTMSLIALILAILSAISSFFIYGSVPVLIGAFLLAYAGNAKSGSPLSKTAVCVCYSSAFLNIMIIFFMLT